MILQYHQRRSLNLISEWQPKSWLISGQICTLLMKSKTLWDRWEKLNLVTSKIPKLLQKPRSISIKWFKKSREKVIKKWAILKKISPSMTRKLSHDQISKKSHSQDYQTPNHQKSRNDSSRLSLVELISRQPISTRRLTKVLWRILNF